VKLATAYRAVSLLVVAAAASMLLACGPGNRFGLWPYPVSISLLRIAAYVAIAGAALALVGLLVPKLRAGGARTLAGALVVSIALFYFPWQFGQDAKSVPRIHDVSTDTENPPQFVAVVPLRAGAPNGPAYDGRETAELQKKGYPDLGPLVLKMPVQVAFNRALDAAQAMGWDIAGSDAAAGRIEATATTLWFGFKDDIVIRVTPEGAEGVSSRVDVRSKSRVGRSDIGANAKRIRAYLASLRG
jgi:uncharacterized protein (DUF1499 family)